MARVAPARETYQPLLSETTVAVPRPLGTGDDLPRVQFTCEIFYGDMAEGEVALDLVRIGPRGAPLSVAFATRDVSARAGETYEATSGRVHFGPDEYLQTVHVPFVRNGLWSATLELEVFLSEPQSCALGAYLHECRVKVIDENCFPTNRYREELSRGSLEHTSPLRLFLAYCKWNARSAGLVTATILTLLFDQMRNVYELVLIYCDMYVVNVICNLDTMEHGLTVEQRVHRAYVIAAIHVLPWLVLLLWERAKVHLDIQGRSALHLQKQMYRKYMNFSYESQEEISGETLEYGLNSDAFKVAGGYVSLLELMREVVSLALSLVFVAMKRQRALPIIGAVVVSIVVWGFVREFYPLPSMRKETKAMSHLVKETLVDRELISSFHIRPQMNRRFANIAETLREKSVAKDLHQLNTDSILKLVAPVFVGFYVSLNIHGVLSGTISLGAFLAIIKVIYSVAKETRSAHEKIEEVMHSYPALRNITLFFNRPTEVRECKEVNRARRRTSLERLSAMAKADIDELPIYCKDLAVTIGGTPVLEKVGATVPQGKIVAVHGENGSGKNMLLRVLSQQQAHSEGELFVPSHLRTLIVHRDPQFLDRSLLNNLVIGRPHLQDGDVPRLKALLDALHLKRLIAVLEQELAEEEGRREEDAWAKGLSHAEKQRLGLARAFFMNPELMCLQTPLANCSETMAEVVNGLLREHVRNRGLGLEPEGAGKRRPRTVVFTADMAQDCHCADEVWEMVASGRRTKAGDPVWTVLLPRRPMTPPEPRSAAASCFAFKAR